MPTQYELIDKVTGDRTPVVLKESNTTDPTNCTVTVAREDGTEVVFQNPNASGDLFNEQYAIREVGTDAQADGTGFVNDAGEQVETTEEAHAEVVAETTAEVVADTTAETVAEEVAPTVAE